MTIEYLGNKGQLLDFILRPILELGDVDTVADVFCGTASVSRALAERGRRVIANDHLHLCATLAEAELLGSATPCFDGLSDAIAPRHGEPRYSAVVRTLNETEPFAGFFYRTYSPASSAHGAARMYLTEENAGKVDAIRMRIADWDGALTRGERAILLRDLVRAVTRVSNTAGTYGCYLKTWKRRAREPIVLAALSSRELPQRSHEVHRGDACELAGAVEADALYLDPPYTKRQYAAYYHLLETLVIGDHPRVTGSTGLPHWQEKRSDFCYSRRAPDALREILLRVRSRHVFLSYSGDGHIPHETVVTIMQGLGRLRWWERPTRRYRSNSRGRPHGLVPERLYHLKLQT
jgi:adenine-specific DNA-methyltransferase